MTYTVEFLETNPEKIAKVTSTPGWFERTFRRRVEQVRFARTLMFGSFWVWDDSGTSVDVYVEQALINAYYRQFEHAARALRVEERRRVNPDGTLRPSPSKC